MPINALQFSTHYGFSFGYNFISVLLWGARIGESIHVDSVTIPNSADEMFRVWVVAVLFLMEWDIHFPRGPTPPDAV